MHKSYHKIILSRIEKLHVFNNYRMGIFKIFTASQFVGINFYSKTYFHGYILYYLAKDRNSSEYVAYHRIVTM